MLGDCPTIHVGGAHELFRRVIQQIRLERLSNEFLLALGFGICEGVSVDSRHGIGHVDIQVGSCIYLSVIVCHDMYT